MIIHPSVGEKPSTFTSTSVNNCSMSTSWEVDNETMAGVNSRFAEVTENDILRMQDITIPNNTKKATKLGMEVFRDKQCFNTQFAHMSSVFWPDRQALSLNNCPSTAPDFKVPSPGPSKCPIYGLLN